MAYTEHTPVKPEKIVGVASAGLEQELVLPAVFRRESIEPFRGAKDDTINVTVPGVLPYRSYGWRNDRSTAIQYDTYSEKKIARSFGDDIYSGVELTDEQATMDFNGWTKLAGAQVDAIGRGLAVKSTRAVENAPYEVRVTLDPANLRKSLVTLKIVMDRLRVPGDRTLFVNDELEIALLDDDKLNLASNVGDAEAESALREASLGRKFKFNFVKGDELVTDSYALMDSGFVFLTAAPAVPQSAWGATASADGVALRWVKGFDIDHGVEKSVFMAYQSFDVVKDQLLGYDVNDQPMQTTDEHFVRGVQVVLGDTDGAFSIELGNAEIGSFTGLDALEGAAVEDIDAVTGGTQEGEPELDA
jgi:hypothetical protein